jgi:hypothetical protein
MLINLNETEVKFTLYAVREMAAKLEAKLTSEAKLSSIVEVMKPVTAGTVRLTKAGKPAKKPGRKPGKKPVAVVAEQQAA